MSAALHRVDARDHAARALDRLVDALSIARDTALAEHKAGEDRAAWARLDERIGMSLSDLERAIRVLRDWP